MENPYLSDLIIEDRVITNVFDSIYPFINKKFGRMYHIGAVVSYMDPYFRVITKHSKAVSTIQCYQQIVYLYYLSMSLFSFTHLTLL